MPARSKTSSNKENSFTRRREPFYFMLWLGISSSVLIFTVILAVYMMRKMGSGWQSTPLPGIFWASTLVIMLSSVTLHEARNAFNKERFAAYRSCLGLTLFLGAAFMAMQGYGWLQMAQAGLTLGGNASAAFVYVLTGLHLAHILGGLVFMAFLLREAIKNKSYVDSFVYRMNAPNQLKLKIMVAYWNFVDVLWLFLFLFLLYHRSA